MKKYIRIMLLLLSMAMIGSFFTSCNTINEAVYLDESAKNALDIEENDPVIKVSNWMGLCKFASREESFDNIIAAIDQQDNDCIENLIVMGYPSYYTYEEPNILKKYWNNKSSSSSIHELELGHDSNLTGGVLFFLKDPFFAFRYSSNSEIPPSVHIENVRLLHVYFGMYILYQTDQGDFVCLVDHGREYEGYDTFTWLAYMLPFDEFCKIAPKMYENGATGSYMDMPVGGYLNARRGIDLSQWEITLPSEFTE